MNGSRRRAYAVCSLLCGVLAMPAGAMAAGPSGGSGLAPGSSAPASTRGSGPPSATSSPQSPVVGSANTTVTASGNGITLNTNDSAMLSRGLSFTGTAPSRLAGDTIEIERSGHQTGWTWTPTVSAAVAPNGTFAAVWNVNHIGRFSIRAVVAPSGEAQSATETPSLTITAYRPSLASWYGPGLYGSHVACGGTLTKHTLGVANKTLRCGELVAFDYQGRTITVPVIDRGPYIKGRDWDLTEAAANALGLKAAGVAQVGAVSLPAR